MSQNDLDRRLPRRIPRMAVILAVAACIGLLAAAFFRDGSLGQNLGIHRFFLFGMPALIILTALVYWICRWRRPLGDAMAALEKLAAGNTDFRLAGLTRKGPIGRISRLLWNCRNAIVRRRDAEEAARRQLAEKSAMFNNALVGMFSERNGIIAACNTRVEELFGYQPGELIGSHYRVLIASEAEYGRVRRQIDEAFSQGKPYSDEVELARKDGADFRGALTGRAGGTMSGLSGCNTWICADISHRKGAAGASGAVQGSLLPQRGFPADERLSVERLPFDLEATIGGVTALLACKAEEKGLELVLDIDIGPVSCLIGDPLCLGRVLNHLIGNAIRFSHQGEVVLFVRERSRLGNHVEIDFSVRDRGIGLSPDQRARIFTLLNHADTSFSRGRGSGLGLAMCKSLVEVMGGSMKVQSQYGEGCSFSFTARFGIIPAVGDVPAYVHCLKPFSGRRVMVVDDNPSSRLLTGALLEKLGFTPDLFDSGKAALAKLGTVGSPGYLFCCLDWRMPEFDGIQMARSLRAHYGRACPPLVLMATLSRTGKLEDAGNDFAAIASKPLTLEQLFGHVGALLRLPGAGNHSTPLPNDQSLKGKRVLLVEDTDLHQEVIADFLRQSEAQVRLAANGLEALQAVREETPDCILMDCHMPLMDGFEATVKLRARGFCDLPIIGLTANDFREGAQRCLEAGMNDFIGKPVDFAALHATMSRWTLQPEHGILKDTVSIPGCCVMPQMDSEVLPPLPAGLDVESGLQRLQGRTGLFLKALRMFRDSRGHQFQLDFRTAIAVQDWPTSEHLAHSLKGAAASIGANSVSAAAASLEAAIQAGNYGDIQFLLADVTDKLRAIVDGLAHIG